VSVAAPKKPKAAPAAITFRPTSSPLLGPREKDEAREPAGVPPVPAGSPPVPPKAAAPEPPAFSFPGRSRCPRCHSLDTERTGDDGKTQYRRCRRVHCRAPYKIQGTVV
jgi:hypothetical protein